MTGTMLATVMRGPGMIEIDQFPIPEMREGEALIQMETAAICGSDVHVVYDGWAREDAFGRPGYPGHEGVGQVVESRSPRFQPGDRVLTVPPGWYGGCFAQYQVVRDQWLLQLPEGGDWQRLLMAQQLGTTIFGLRKFWSRPPGRTATVLGSGSAGLFFLQQLRRMGFEKVIVSDLEPGRLAVARSLGAAVTVLAPDESVVDATLAETRGEGADLVIEAAGYDITREWAVECVRKWGQIGYFGYPERPGLAPFPFERAYRKAVTIDFIIDTALEPGLKSIADAVDAIHTGVIDVSYSLNERFPLEDINDALGLARDRGRGSIKIRVDLLPPPSGHSLRTALTC
jgi:L-iditol 2-dehydrogenase